MMMRGVEKTLRRRHLLDLGCFRNEQETRPGNSFPDPPAPNGI